MEEQLATGWGLTIFEEPLSGDFESVNAQFPPGGFGSTNRFPLTVSVFPPGDFVESANSLPPVDFHESGKMCSPLATLTRRTLTTQRTFSCCKRRAIYDLGQVSLVRKLIVPSEIGSQIKTGKYAVAVSVFCAWCQVCEVKCYL